jgi:YesN/AraC family two-component response regulator
LSESGFGIGLALAKGIVDKHKGYIFVESIERTKDTEGFTKFTIELPLGNTHFTKEEIQTGHKTSEQLESFISLENKDNVPSETDEYQNFSGSKCSSILLVEDNEQIREYLKSKLEGGYKIREAANGVDALEIAVKYLPDIIISDVLMPLMDGIELTARLKSDERTNHIPVILLTARTSLIHEMEGLEKGADEYITKPFNVNLLKLKLNNILLARQRLQQKFSKRIILEPKNVEHISADEKFIQKLVQIIEEEISNPEFNVNALVNHIGMSRPVLFRKVKALTGLSVIDLIIKTRLKKAAILLKQNTLNISEVAYSIGFSDSKYFSKSFRKEFGMSPSDYISTNSATPKE